MDTDYMPTANDITDTLAGLLYPEESEVEVESGQWEDRAWLGALGDEWARHHADELVGR